MKRNVLAYGIGLSVLVFVFCCNVPSFAEEDTDSLKQQIEALQQRVEELEKEKQKAGKDDDFFSGSFQGAWDPLTEIQRMQEEMNRMFQSSFSQRGWANGGFFSNRLNFNKTYDFKENENGYEIIFDMAGFDKDKVDIQINEHSVMVKGEHSRQDEENGPNRYMGVQAYGSFMQTIPLPLDADTTKVKTEKVGDNLVIRLPKKTT